MLFDILFLYVISILMNKLRYVITSLFLLIFNVVADGHELRDLKINLYSIEKDGKLSYVVGTIHCIPLSLIQKEIQEILISQEYLVIESKDNDKLNNAILFLNENDENWWDQLSENERNVLSISPLIKIKNYKIPFAVSNLMHWNSEETMRIITGLVNFTGMDSFLENFYSQENVYVLETADEIASVLLKSKLFIDIEDLKYWLPLSEGLQGPEKVRFAEEHIDESFFPMEDYSNEDMLYDNLIDDRNLLWIDRIENFHKNLDGKVLFAFGEAHLYSNQGILKLLKNRDFKVTKITFDCLHSNKIDL